MKRNYIFKDAKRILDFQSEYPDLAPKKVLIIDAEILSKILTPARMELIKAIRKKKPQTIGELCKAVGRSKESVSRDLKVLHNYGILDLIKNGKAKKPVYEKEAIIIKT